MAHPPVSGVENAETKRPITLELKTNYFDYQNDNSLEPRFSKPAAAEKSPDPYIENEAYRERSQQTPTQMMDQVVQDEETTQS